MVRTKEELLSRFSLKPTYLKTKKKLNKSAEKGPEVDMISKWKVEPQVAVTTRNNNGPREEWEARAS